jgi:pyruvate kinase
MIVRKTKIVATIGPATDSPEQLGKLIDAGMNVARLNMSHATHDWMRRVVTDIRAAALARQTSVGIMLDTQGPSIRTGDLPAALDLKPGEQFVLTVKGERSEELHSVDVNYENFISDINVGEHDSESDADPRRDHRRSQRGIRAGRCHHAQR